MAPSCITMIANAIVICSEQVEVTLQGLSYVLEIREMKVDRNMRIHVGVGGRGNSEYGVNKNKTNL